jgi:hypothetical protein
VSRGKYAKRHESFTFDELVGLSLMAVVIVCGVLLVAVQLGKAVMP